MPFKIISDTKTIDPKYITKIHTPIWRGGDYGEKKILFNSFKNELNTAIKNNVSSITLQLITSKERVYPKSEALRTAVSSIEDFLLKNDMEVYLLIEEKNSILLSTKLFEKIGKYIDDRYRDEETVILESYNLEELTYNENRYASKVHSKKRNLEDLLSNHEETFSEMLMRLIDQKGMTDVEAYKKANVDRRLFSKIRTDLKYKPSKITAISFAISLNLNLDETYDLLQRAGYALSPSNKFDIIIEFFIEEENFNIYEINEALFSFNQSLLGA